ncbi:hypothetical protein Tco_1385278 [Tanacetum coccineum]
MIQPKPEGSVLRYEKRSKSKNKGKVPTEMELVLEQTQQGTSYEVSSDTQVITMKMEILLEPTSNKLMREVITGFTLILLFYFESSSNEKCGRCLPASQMEVKNDLKAQTQDKVSTICKLKDIIKSMREKSTEENVKYDYFDIQTKNVELENSMAKLLLENKRLCNEINHVKQNEDLKAQIQDKVFVITSLKNDLRKLKRKEIVDISVHTIVPGMFKLDVEPLAPRLLQNREMHIAYLKYTQEQADFLRGIVKQAKEKQPLDKELDFACKYAERIQELLVYVRDTCPNAIKLNEKKVAVTPKNKVKKVRFTKPLTSSSNSKQVESSKSLDSNTYVLSSYSGLRLTSNWDQRPTGNKG